MKLEKLGYSEFLERERERERAVCLLAWKVAGARKLGRMLD